MRTDVVLVRNAANQVLGRMPLSGTGNGPQASLAPGIATELLPSGNNFTIPSAWALDALGNA
jgi:hypothetical protein